jgi:hypothetical protein
MDSGARLHEGRRHQGEAPRPFDAQHVEGEEGEGEVADTHGRSGRVPEGVRALKRGAQDLQNCGSHVSLPITGGGIAATFIGTPGMGARRAGWRSWDAAVRALT